MRNNKVAVRKVDKKNEMHEKLRRELVHSVAEELIEDPNKFLLFANIAIHETPWEVVKDKYFFVLPESLFFLEGMWPHVDRDSIIPDVQVAFYKTSDVRRLLLKQCGKNIRRRKWLLHYFFLQRKISMRKILRAMVLAEKMQTLQTECFRFLRSLMW